MHINKGIKMFIKRLIVIILAIVFHGEYLQANAINNDSVIVSNVSNDSDEAIRIPSKDEIVASGIPNCVMPAKAYFNSLNSHCVYLWNELDLKESALSSTWQDFDVYYFFVKPTMKKMDEFPLIDIWAYNATKRQSKLVYHQVDDSVDICNVVGIDWMYGGKAHSTPIMILSTIGTIQGHYEYSTVIIDVLKGKVVSLKDQKLVSVLHLYDEMVPIWDVGLHESYILTTRSNWKLKFDELVPYLYIFDCKGALVRKISLPIQSVPEFPLD